MVWYYLIYSHAPLVSRARTALFRCTLSLLLPLSLPLSLSSPLSPLPFPPVGIRSGAAAKPLFPTPELSWALRFPVSGVALTAQKISKTLKKQLFLK